MLAAVRKVFGSTSKSAAKTVLKTQKWSTLTALGIATYIMRAFGTKSPRVARRLVKETLRNWKKSSARTDMQIKRQKILLAAVRKVYGSTSKSAVKAVLKTQKWSTLKALGITTHIMRGFGKLGYRKASKNARVARRLVKKTLKHWKNGS